MKKSIIALAAIGVTLVAGGAQASNGKASLTNITLTYYDLNPLDGVTPAFTTGTMYDEAYVNVNGAGPTKEAMGPTFDLAANFDSNNFTHIVGNSTGQSITTSGESSVLGSKGYGSNVGSILTYFTLAPGAALKYSAQADVSFYSTGPAGTNGEGASATVTFTVFDNDHYISTEDSISVGEGYVNREAADEITTYLVNTSNRTYSGYMEAYGEVNTVGYSVSAVPEPASVAMLLIGLGFLGFAAMRRMQ